MNVLSKRCHPEQTSPSLCHPERSKPPAKRAARGVEGPLPPLQQLAARLLEVHTLIKAALREIFDESAYDRFLRRQDLHPSAATYAAFWSEHEAAKMRRPRCC